MRRRIRSESDDGGGLDSLLDTMTNVVGILVMVLIATQLGVKDAVNRISDSEIVDPEALAEAQAKLKLTEDQRQVLETQLSDLQNTDDQTVQVELADLRRRLDATRSQLQQEKQKANQYAVKIEQDRKRADAAKKMLAALKDAEKNRDKLQQELTTALETEAKLKSQLAETPVPQAPPPKIVTLPDPRPAPEGARAVWFLCANNKVYPIAADDWRTTIRKQAEFIVQARGLDRGPAVGVDQERLFNEFRKGARSRRDDFFELELYAAGIYPRIRFTPKKNAGATIREVLNPRSRFQRILRSVDPNKYYARFLVLPDSYEVYLAARAVATEHNLLAGWEPQSDGYVFTTHLGGKILFGPKPPPDPNAKPAPPAKPANVID